MLKLQNPTIHLTSTKSDISNFSPTIAAVACFLQAEQQLLLLKNDNPTKFQNKVWGVPGGKIESNESPTAAAVRELHEETGISLPEQNLIFVIKLYVRVENFDYEFYIYQAELKQSLAEIKIKIDSREHSEYIWKKPQEALALELISGEKELIEYMYLSTSEIK
jgi:8-oxo-dGTP pyrophosphatase MutT (NUDIX family)